MSWYIHLQPDWPHFYWDQGSLAERLATVRHAQGRLIGYMEALGFGLRQEAELRTITEDVLRSSEIEGERLDADSVRSSVARRLGVDIGGLKPADRQVEGVVEMILDATRQYDHALTAERLRAWHASLFPVARSGMAPIHVGAWRTDSSGPMRVVSGPVGRERIHFEAPAAERLDAEMGQFLDWFNTDASLDEVLKAALAHLWFVTIHPFDDGNGRMARAISDMCLACSERSAQRFYSMSAQIRQERAAYYDVLERTQRGSLDVTPWIAWFLDCLGAAIDGAREMLRGVLRKARFWQAAAAVQINERQRLVLNRMLDGFEGKLTSSKWGKLAKCSHDTALRDISELVKAGLLVRGEEGGRSTGYTLVRDPAASR
jgi:Fic family protein